MKWDCGPTWKEKISAKEQWHKWFAWHPVRIGSHDCRWLETIYRRGTFNSGWEENWWEWEYKEDNK